MSDIGGIFTPFDLALIALLLLGPGFVAVPLIGHSERRSRRLPLATRIVFPPLNRFVPDSRFCVPAFRSIPRRRSAFPRSPAPLPETAHGLVPPLLLLRRLRGHLARRVVRAAR